MPGFMKKTMVYLGLLDDEYDEYDDYEDRAPQGVSAAVSRAEPTYDEVDDRTANPSLGRIRTLPRESAAPAAMAPAALTPRPAAVRPVPVDAARVTVIAPSEFKDAKDIADCLKQNRPVIVNLQVADRDLQRRMIDFCSGVTYALSGEMEKVADQVFLLAPTNVKVSDEERQRLQDRGYGRD
jgi:cell division inhibitor SepF